MNSLKNVQILKKDFKKPDDFIAGYSDLWRERKRMRDVM
jgi:hypothetical protein